MSVLIVLSIIHLVSLLFLDALSSCPLAGDRHFDNSWMCSYTYIYMIFTLTKSETHQQRKKVG